MFLFWVGEFHILFNQRRVVNTLLFYFIILRMIFYWLFCILCLRFHTYIGLCENLLVFTTSCYVLFLALFGFSCYFHTCVCVCVCVCVEFSSIVVYRPTYFCIHQHSLMLSTSVLMKAILSQCQTNCLNTQVT